MKNGAKAPGKWWLKNKYWKQYHAIIKKAVHRRKPLPTGEYEVHHIIPVSLGGKHFGMVPLSFEEHFHVHVELLPNIVVGANRQRKMVHAKWRFVTSLQHRGRITPKVYAEAKNDCNPKLSAND
jgi:hypothetical protein